MGNFKVNNVTAFVPSKDFQLSCQFYENLGFQKTVTNGDAIRYEIDGFGFWLQDYYVKEFAENCMLCLYVEDIYAWHERVKKLELSENYGEHAKVFSEPHEEFGSLIMNLTDPSGVLWHIYQGTQGANNSAKEICLFNLPSESYCMQVTCHCKNISIEVAPPTQITSCNCSICSRYSALWGYYKPNEVKITIGEGGEHFYSWGDNELEFVRCAKCGCVTHYRTVDRYPNPKIAVNFRLVSNDLISNTPMRYFNGKELL